MKIFWNKDYISVNHSFDTTRKSLNVIDLLELNKNLPSQLKELKDVPKNIEVVDPDVSIDSSVTDDLIDRFCDPLYVRALKTGDKMNLAESSGFPWDKNTYKFARAHTHGLIASIEEVIKNGGRSGSLSSGLHHGSPRGGCGFCTINGIALSAIFAQSKGFHPIVLDFDAHCGGGTMEFLDEFVESQKSTDITHIDLSTNSFDSYDTGDKPWAYLDICGNQDNYLHRIELALKEADKFRNDKTIFIYNAGVDPVGAHGIDHRVIAEREKMVSDFIGKDKAVFALAGGYSGQSYSRNEVARDHLLNIVEWAWKTK